MSVINAPDTEYSKERVRWEAQHTECGPPGRPYVFREFPMRIFKAGRPENGLGAHIITDEIEVGSENEEAQYRSRGFRRSPKEACDVLDAQQAEFAALNAELNYEQKNKLSDRASAEVDAARAEHAGGISHHLPAVPVTPIKKRGRPKATPKES